MFRESSAIDSERTAASVRSLYAKYSGNDNWFDGSPDSVDRRIAQAKKISNLCKAASVRLSGRNASSQYIALAHEMDSDRTALEGLRRDLLTAAADRDEDEPKTNPWGGRVCKECGGYFEDNGCICDIKNRNKTSMRRDLLTAAADREEFGWTPEERNIDPELRDRALSLLENPPAYRPEKARYRAEARHFIAEQECDDLRELTIRAKNYAEKVSSTLPANKSRAFVASFVEAVRGEHRVAAGNYSMDHYMEYARRNGLHPGDKLTVDRYSREHGVPQERASDYAMQFNKSANRRIAATADFPASLMYLE